MNMRLKRILAEIQKTEQRIAEWQEHLKDLNVRKKRLEDAEIIKSIRSMKLESRQLLEVLESIQSGMVSLLDFDASSASEDTKELTNMGNAYITVTETMDSDNRPENAAENKEDDNSECEN